MDFQRMTENVYTITQDLIDRFGPRRTGSQSALDCADALADGAAEYADHVGKQDFQVHTGAFLGWIRIIVSLYILGVVSLWLNWPLLTAALLLTGILIMVFQFFLYKHTIDFLYPARKGRNITTVLEPEGEVKQQILISGHHDSACVFNFFIHQPKLYSLRVMGGIGILVGVFLLSLIWGVGSFSEPFTIGLAALATAGLAIVVQLWFFASRHATPGAGDNLAASVMAMEVLRGFAEKKSQGQGLRHTRLIAVSFDGEEEGLRGAYAYAKAHQNVLKDIPTYLYNVDCPYQLKDMFFLTSDINGSVQLSESFAHRCGQAAQELGYEAEVKPITFLTGGTDAGELAKVGVHATTMMAMPWDNSERAAVYHTPDDTLDHVEKAAVEAAIKIIVKVTESIDQES